MRTIVPVNNQVLIRRRVRAKKTDAGLFIPDVVDENADFIEGEVLAVGPGRFIDWFEMSPALSESQVANGKRTPMPCKAGDLVIATRHGKDVGDDLWIFCDHEILATVVGGN